MNAATTRAVEELAEAMDITPDEVVERAVRLLAIHQTLLWSVSPRTLARVNEREGE